MNPYMLLLAAAIFYSTVWNMICGHPQTGYEWIGFIGTWYMVNYFHGIFVETFELDKE